MEEKNSSTKKNVKRVLEQNTPIQRVKMKKKKNDVVHRLKSNRIKIKQGNETNVKRTDERRKKDEQSLLLLCATELFCSFMANSVLNEREWKRISRVFFSSPRSI